MRPVGLEVADIFRQVGPSYREDHVTALNCGQRRAMSAIEQCRTAALGGHVEQCDSCGHQRIAFNSCRNRHCPKCQSLVRAQWLEDRRTELLPVEYFHVVFTVPQEISAIAYQNKAVVYDILFRTTAETLHTIAGDPKHLGAEIGFIAILHTWGQNLSKRSGISSVNRWRNVPPSCFRNQRGIRDANRSSADFALPGGGG